MTSKTARRWGKLAYIMRLHTDYVQYRDTFFNRDEDRAIRLRAYIRCLAIEHEMKRADRLPETVFTLDGKISPVRYWTWRLFGRKDHDNNT